MSDTSQPAAPSIAPPAAAALLLVVSVTGLFLELLFIRWIGSELSVFGHLQNAVLIVCFLGCWTCRRPVRPRDVLTPLALLMVLITLLRLNQYSPLRAFATWSAVKPWSELLDGAALLGMALEVTLAGIVVVLLWSLFVPVGRLLDDHPHTIRAYSGRRNRLPGSLRAALVREMGSTCLPGTRKARRTRRLACGAGAGEALAPRAGADSPPPALHASRSASLPLPSLGWNDLRKARAAQRRPGAAHQLDQTPPRTILV